MTKRYIGSLLIGVLAGIAIGVFIGWEQFPVEYTNSPSRRSRLTIRRNTR